LLKLNMKNMSVTVWLWLSGTSERCFPTGIWFSGTRKVYCPTGMWRSGARQVQTREEIWEETRHAASVQVPITELITIYILYDTRRK
jgi:hypothetical protein